MQKSTLLLWLLTPLLVALLNDIVTRDEPTPAARLTSGSQLMPSVEGVERVAGPAIDTSAPRT